MYARQVQFSKSILQYLCGKVQTTGKKIIEYFILSLSM